MNPAIALEEALAAIKADCDNARRIFVGFSGGLDSTVLLHQAARSFPQEVRALHGNHGLHGDADEWAEHCREICAVLAVPFESHQLQVIEDGHGPEAAARDARYRWFAEVLEAGDVLLLAHHLDDQVETLLLRLLRGAGPDGLGAMRSRRALGAAVLLRPFLDLPRSVLRQQAEDQQLRWIEDPSNSASRYDRNFLRNDVLPLIAGRWPGYRKTLGRAATQLQAFADAQLIVSLKTVYSVVGDPGFAIDDLPDDAVAAGLSLRHWLKTLGLPMPPASRLKEFQRQLAEGQGATLATESYQLIRYRNAVYCRTPDEPHGQTVEAIELGEHRSRPGLGELRVLAEEPEKLPEGLTVRFRQSGDRMATAGGHHRDLKDLFQEHNIPPWWRDRVPLICSTDEGREGILALGPFCLSPLAEQAGLMVNWTPVLPLTD